MHVLERPNISAEIADTLRRGIFDGTLAPGARINEVHLAAELGVSRTPLREALSALVSEGALASVPRRGFFVHELTREEFEGIYPIRALLDPEALRLSGLPDEDLLAELDRLNAGLREAQGAEERIDRDDRWHLTLLRDCPNKVLLDLIRQFMGRTRRYELAYLRETRHRTTAYLEHRKIVRALRDGELGSACEELRGNLKSGREPILQWLERRAESDEE